MRLTLIFIYLLLLAGRVCAAEPMVAKYLGTNPGVREDYFQDLIQTALQTTEATYGPYRFEYSEELISSMRKNEMLLQGERLNVSRISGFDRRSHPANGALKVNVPLLRGFMGFRIPLIRRVSQPSFDSINSIEELRKIPLGLGQGWEGYIYKKNGFVLHESLNMMLLLEMLVAGRFDFVPLGATEIESHYQVDKQSVDSLMPENHLLIYMPMPTFFYVSPNNPELAKRLYEGLKKIEANGKMKAIFNKYYAERLKNLHLSQRTIINIPNPEDDGSLGEMDFSILKDY